MKQSDSFCKVYSDPPIALAQPIYSHCDKDPAHHFYRSCDQDTQGILWQCTWGFITTANFPTLLIKCPSAEVYWRILTSLSLLADRMIAFSYQAHIRIYPPHGEGGPLEVAVAEITVH